MVSNTRDWRTALGVYRHPQVFVMLMLGFAAGLPFLLLFSTLTAWLTEAGLPITEIGFFGWIGITYSIKVFWAPWVDQWRLPLLNTWLGQRRSWMLVGQLGIMLGLSGMSVTDPVEALNLFAAFALLTAFASATHDISVDAYRIEAAADHWQGAMTASYQTGYRIALLVAYSGALVIAEWQSWTFAYQVMASLMLVGIVTVLVTTEPTQHAKIRPSAMSLTSGNAHNNTGNWLRYAVIAPLADFFQRQPIKQALLILGLVGCYRASDIVMGGMANPLYLELGFSKTELATISGVYGLIMTLVGAGIGGLVIVRYGIARPLLLGAVCVALTNVLFTVLATADTSLALLTVVISMDNFTGGFAVSAFIAYLSSLTNREFTATQYALFSSLMTLPAKFIAGFSGLIVAEFTYTWFFIYAALLGLPAIGLTLYLYQTIHSHHKGNIYEQTT